MNLLFKEVAKRKGLELGKLAEKAGISYPSFNKRMKNPTFETLKEMAELFECNVLELIEASAGFQHEYNERGEWLGIYPINGEKLPLYIKNELGEIVKIGEVDKGKFNDEKEN